MYTISAFFIYQFHVFVMEQIFNFNHNFCDFQWKYIVPWWSQCCFSEGNTECAAFFGMKMVQWKEKLITLIFQSSSAKLLSPTFKMCIGWSLFHTLMASSGSLPLTHTALTFITVCLFPLPRGLSRPLQQQWTVHPGGQWLALHLPIRMERGRVSRSHGNTLYRWKG